MASVGRLAGLQPSVAPLGTVRVGGVVSAVQVKTTVVEVELLHASMALTANVRVSTQPLMASVWVTLMVTAPQASVAVTCPAMLASVGKLVGLQPRLPPVSVMSVGGVVSAVQV